MTSAVDVLIARSGSGKRADARRNVERLVTAARAALDEVGLGLTTRDVAQRAGVGLGTLYRHMPSLDALVKAILLDSLAEMTAQATLALQDPDAWHGFTGFAETFVQLRAASCGLHDALSGDLEDVVGEPVNKLRRAVQRLVRHAQAAGALREDIDWRDIPFVLASAIPPDHTIGLPARRDQWERNLHIILRGLQP
jgi:AcrR family transcriptional regulator